MEAGKIKESVYLAFLSALSVPFSSAQITEGDGGFGGIGGGGVGNTGVEASLVEFANTILLFQVGSAADVLLYFLAPIAGFYFIQKNILSYGFELFEERIDRHTYGRTDDDIPNGIKGLSIVTGFITVQMLGMLGAGVLLVTGLLSILLAFLMQFGLLEGALGGGDGDGRGRTNTGGGNNGGNNNNGGGRTQNTQGGGGGGNVNWNQVGQTAANFANNVNQAQQNRNNRSIKEALEVFNSGKDVPTLIDKEPADFRNHVNEIRNARKGDAEDLESLESVVDRMKSIERKMEDMQQYATNDIQDSNDWPDSDLRKQFQGWEMSDTNVINILRKIREDLQRVKEDQKNTASTLQDQLDHSWDDIQIYINIHEFGQKLPKSPGRVANNNQLLSELAEEARDRNLASGRNQQQAKKDFRDALEKIDQFENAHQNLLENFESELSQDLKIDKSDGEDLNDISTQDKAIISTAKNVDQLLNQIPAGSGGNPTQSEVENKLGLIKGLGEQIDNEVQDIYSIVESEGKFENKSYRKLKDLT